MPKIVLSTLNAKYIHASMGLRYLFANMQELQQHTKIHEFTIHSKTLDICETILNESPKIVGFGVYIWNVNETLAVIRMIKQISPELTIVVGGPEVSYETESQPIYNEADYVITGPADFSFYEFCTSYLTNKEVCHKIIKSAPVDQKKLQLPYEHYTNTDLSQRVIYVEASRGCPFKCEFCLSSLDKGSTPFDLDRFLNEMDKLFDRGCRNFKFVDRTFNLKIKTTLRILDYFLDKIKTTPVFLHFEMIPDHLTEELKEKLILFPPGLVQLEIGIQTFNPEVQNNISRRQKNDLSKANLIWLKENTNIHMHVDLIFGLPGETLESFSDSFDQLFECKPHEIQMGILKRLKGSPIIRHTEEYQLRFNPDPPYNILSNRDVDFKTMQRINRFARYWDIIGNSGRFTHFIENYLDTNPFYQFLELSDWLYEKTKQTHKFNLKNLFHWLVLATNDLRNNEKRILNALHEDFENSSIKGKLDLDWRNTEKNTEMAVRSKRQEQHIN